MRQYRERGQWKEYDPTGGTVGLQSKTPGFRPGLNRNLRPMEDDLRPAARQSGHWEFASRSSVPLRHARPYRPSDELSKRGRELLAILNECRSECSCAKVRLPRLDWQIYESK